MSVIHILPNLRKGLSHRITPGVTDPEGLRPGFQVEVQMSGHPAGKKAAKENVPIGGDGPSLSRPFYLAGPVDVQSIREDAVSLAVPADKSKGVSFEYMPFLEFHEEDFPWRYTPLPSSDKLVPWLLLLACKDGEFTLTMDSQGNHRVEINLEGVTGEERTTFYPKKAEFHRLAHVQVTTPGSEDPVAWVADHPDDGVSRLFCSRKLSDKTHYTVFLVPAFELGRLAGLGEDFAGKAALDRLSFEDDPDTRTFPVYYQWSFTSGRERFMELAGRQRFLDEVESASLAPGLRVNISETGLMGTPVSPWETVDVPVALVKPDFSEDDLTSEDGQLDQELKDLLLKNPVFSDDAASHPVYEDPWVVPPVYGARHILAKPEALEDDSLFLKDLNLKFRNRAAAGLGAEVVKKNQEFFVNRAWGVVETINELNQRIREFYEVLKANGASDAKTTALRKYFFGPKVMGLQADAAIRVAGAQSASDVNPIDLATDVSGGALNVMFSSMPPYARSAGITAEELEAIGSEETWQTLQKEICQMHSAYKFLSGELGFFQTMGPKYAFVESMVNQVAHPDVSFVSPKGAAAVEVKVKPAKGREYLFYLQANYRADSSRLEDIVFSRSCLGYENSGVLLRWLGRKDKFNYDQAADRVTLQSLIDTMESGLAEYGQRWEQFSGRLDLKSVTLPVSLFFGNSPSLNGSKEREKMLEEKYVGNGYFLKQAFYDKYFSGYPNGFAIDLNSFEGGTRRTYFLPQSKFLDYDTNTSTGYYFIYDTDKVGESGKAKRDIRKLYLKVRRQWGEDYFGPCDKEIDPWMLLPGGVRVMYTDFFDGSTRGNYDLLLDLDSQSKRKGVEIIPLNLKYPFKRSLRIMDFREDTFWLELLMGSAVISVSRVNGKGDTLGSFTVGVDQSICWFDDKAQAWVDWERFYALVRKALTLIQKTNQRLWRPNLAVLHPSRIKDLPVITPDDMVKEKFGVKNAQEAEKLLRSTYESFIRQVVDYRASEVLQEVWKSLEQPNDVREKSEQELDGVDADALNRKRLVEVVQEFSERGMTMDLMESNFDGKYPVMAAPVFPDPTSFYLRELSERYLLPSVEEIAMNSISVFRTNPAFEEAFLAGMNTEMGRELLWREYPTDERGSYFRKFWDQVHLPDDFGKDYFDVKYLHNWKGRLGENHESGKERMLVFVVRSELMKQYPQTTLCLAQVGNADGRKSLRNVVEPEITGWLSKDTFMAGFYPDKLPQKDGVYLTFVETDKSQRFMQAYAGQGPDGLSTEFALNRKENGSVWGIEIAPDSLTLK